MNAVRIKNLSHQYKERVALRELNFSVSVGEIFGLVGPNGGGKSTTFRILSTLMKPTSGEVWVMDQSLAEHRDTVRKSIGVVFQNPALDLKLKVEENLFYQGHLYGLRGTALKERANVLLERLGLMNRRTDIVETLSGGLRRRLEIAKALLHKPKVLILDEPSSGLDPVVRRELWQYFETLREQEGVTILLTTHYLEEAEKCDRIALLHQGELVALDAPNTLCGQVGGEILSIRGIEPERLKRQVQEKFSATGVLLDGWLRIERKNAHEFVGPLMEAFGGEVEAVKLGKPNLEDFFIKATGDRFGSFDGLDRSGN